VERQHSSALESNRVAVRGGFTDDFVGLRLKAYLMRSGEVNAYAPFYLWDDVDAMGSFLWGGRGFSGIVTDFSRPTVQSWAGVSVVRGDAPASFATKEVFAIAEGETLRMPWTPSAQPSNSERPTVSTRARSRSTHARGRR